MKPVGVSWNREAAGQSADAVVVKRVWVQRVFSGLNAWPRKGEADDSSVLTFVEKLVHAVASVPDVSRCKR